MFLGSISGSMQPLHQRGKTVNSAQVNKLIYNYNYVKVILFGQNKTIKVDNVFRGKHINTKIAGRNGEFKDYAGIKFTDSQLSNSDFFFFKLWNFIVPLRSRLLF